MINTTIAHYRITEKLGEGGMGEVYRATDTKLNRDVALKILPKQFASDGQRMGRFQREAEVLASLSHANIGHIFGIEDAGATKALVLELIEGPTLADRIARGPIPVDEALAIARQIAAALEAAHEKGIIHRDLKPANIKITPEGQVKVLDFGLAKALENDPQSSPDLTRSPTLSMGTTQAGIILGTAAYMSPEQARGKAVDKRADIWAFGAVLYEMLSGRKPFPGEDLSSTLARVIEREPDWEALPDDLPHGLASFLRRCLAKKPGQRIHDIADMRLAIEGSFETGDGGTSTPDTSRLRGAVPWSIAAAATIVALALGVSSGWERIEPQGQAPVRRFSIEMAEGIALPRGAGPTLAVSPDGETIVYAGESSDGSRIFRRSLSGQEATPVPGTEGGTQPFFSPDGQWLAFSVDVFDSLRRVPASGGEPFTICSQCAGGAWGDDDSIVFGREGKLFRVSRVGQQPTVLLEPMPQQGVAAMNGARILPGGKAVVFEIGRFEFGGVGVFSLESRELLIITDNGSDPSYSPTGHILFGREDTWFAVPFDLDQFRVKGQPAPVLTGVRVENGGAVQAALSTDGLLVYATADATGNQLVWVDRAGQVQSVIEEGRIFHAPRISPDGKQIAVQVNAGGSTDIWLHQSGTLRPLTNTGTAASPIWAPDNRAVTFSSRSNGSFAIQSVSIDDPAEPSTLVSGDSRLVPEAWSLDGTRLIFLEDGSDLFVTDVASPGSRTPYAASAFTETAATLSPSGDWVAYVSNQTGSNEVYLRPFPGPGQERLISRGGGWAPSWGGEDSELMFRSLDNRHLIAASLQFDPFRVEQTVLFSAELFWGAAGRAHYDVHPDGRRFLMLNQREPDRGGSSLRVVQNWFSELERLAPAGN